MEDIYEYIKQKKELYITLIEFLDAETKSSINDYKILRTTFQNIKQMKDQKEIKSLFHLIIQISHNDFFNDKIDEIVNYFFRYKQPSNLLKKQSKKIYMTI